MRLSSATVSARGNTVLLVCHHFFAHHVAFFPRRQTRARVTTVKAESAVQKTRTRTNLAKTRCFSSTFFFYIFKQRHTTLVQNSCNIRSSRISFFNLHILKLTVRILDFTKFEQYYF